MVRPLEEQFNAETVKSIRSLIDRTCALNFPDGSSRYYAVELAHCLEAGVLLGSLHVAASLLELVVRGIAIERLGQATQEPIDWEHRLEEMRHLGFKKLVDHLVEADLFAEDDGNAAKKFYDAVRIPVHHGLPGRYVAVHDEIIAAMKPLLGFSMPTSSRDLEDVIERFAVSQIESVVGIIERNSSL